MLPDENTPDITIAFAGTELIAAGPLPEVAAAAKRALDAGRGPVLAFDATTSHQVELDLRGTVEDVVARVTPPAPEPAPARPPGRPRLGVVAREVTLLPRHWEWLATQPGGASVTLRKLVERARLEGTEDDRVREATDSTYRFMLAMAGNEPGYEEANRALFSGDRARFELMTEEWPVDVRDHARSLAARAFAS